MSDTLFGTDGIRGKAGQPPLTSEPLHRLGQVLAQRLGPGKRLVAGHDGRESGESITADLVAGLNAGGVHVDVIGLAPTPAIAFLAAQEDFDGGVVISASHNPAEDNGIKLLGADGAKLSDDLELLIEEDFHRDEALEETPTSGECRRTTQRLGDVLAWLRNEAFPNLDLTGMRIALDCAHGAYSRFGPRALKSFGAEVIPIHDRPDGHNINQNCGALYPEVIGAATRNLDANLGLCFDGDGDRGMLVNSDGTVFDGDALLAGLADLLIAAQALPSKTVIATVMSNLALEQWVRQRGAVLQRTAVGDRYVAEALRTLGGRLGGEKSGHILFGTEHGFRGDGLYTLLKVLQLLQDAGKTIDDFAAGYADLPQVLRNLPATERKPLEELPQLSAAIQEMDASLGHRGRTVVRFSGTELKLRLMVEADCMDLVTTTLDVLQDAATRDGILASEAS